jgi:hypothetical protein
MGDNEASISAQDEDSPGTLSFEWTSPTVVPTVLFQNPSTHAYMPSLSGPWSTVGMMVQIPAGRTSSTIPDFDDVSIEVLVQDGGGASIVAENSFYVVVAGNCSNCPASACDCARHADLNSDYFIDAADLAFLIDWVFFGVGPPATDPGCPHVDRGDFNCDGMDDATDISLMIDHVLFGGSPPCEPCDCAAYPTNCP